MPVRNDFFQGNLPTGNLLFCSAMKSFIGFGNLHDSRGRDDHSYSTVMLPALITGPHLRFSAWIKAKKSAPLKGIGVMPSSFRRACMSGVLTMA